MFDTTDDPPRNDSLSLISEYAPATAAIVAHLVGLNDAVCPPGKLSDAVKPADFAVFAGMTSGPLRATAA